MKLRKLLSLFVCTLLVVSTLGVFSVSAAEPDEIVNVPMGAVYTLPTEIDGEAVTWDKAVDTSKFGYNIYTGTTANGTVTYRVNTVKSMDLFDVADMENYEINSTPIALTTAGHSAQAGEVVAYENGESGNKVLKSSQAIAYPARTARSGFLLSDAYKENFSFSMRFKSEHGTKGNGIYMHVSGESAGAFYKGSYGGVYIYMDSNSQIRIKAAPAGRTINIDPNTMSVNPNNTVASGYLYVKNINTPGNWIDLKLSFDVESKTYSIYVIDMSVPVVSGVPYNYDAAASVTTPQVLEMGYRIAPAKYDGTNYDTTYIDDLRFMGDVYVTDDLTTKSISANLKQGDSAYQTLTMPLTLNDGTTENFTVSYTADTSKGAKGLTAEGEIEGFSDKVTVTYDVLPVSDQTISAVVGQTVTLADGSTIIPEAIGVLKKTVATEDEIVNYTINVSGYVVKYSDDMEDHGDDTFVYSKDNSITYKTIAPATNSDFQLEIYNDNNGTISGVIEEGADGKYIVIDRTATTSMTSDKNMAWKIGSNGITENFRISARMKAEGFGTGTLRPFTFEMYQLDKKTHVTHNIALQCDRTSTTKDKDYISFRTTNEGVANTTGIPTTLLTESTHNVSYVNNGLDWFNLDIDFDFEAQTYTLYVNGALVSSATFGNETNHVGYIVFEDRAATSFDGKVYFDDLRVSVLDSFDGNMPASVDTVAGMGAEGEVSSKIELSTVGGLKFYPTATYTVDTATVGNKTAVATVEGFTDPVSVNVKVCNYNVVAGDNKAVLTNISGAAGATALVAYYTGDVFIKADDLIAVNAAKGATQDIPYSAPAGATTVKVFIINNVASVQPIDLVTEIPLA